MLPGYFYVMPRLIENTTDRRTEVCISHITALFIQNMSNGTSLPPSPSAGDSTTSAAWSPAASATATAGADRFFRDGSWPVQRSRAPESHSEILRRASCRGVPQAVCRMSGKYRYEISLCGITSQSHASACIRYNSSSPLI